jgi:hypothetical protein
MRTRLRARMDTAALPLDSLGSPAGCAASVRAGAAFRLRLGRRLVRRLVRRLGLRSGLGLRDSPVLARRIRQRRTDRKTRRLKLPTLPGQLSAQLGLARPRSVGSSWSAPRTVACSRGKPSTRLGELALRFSAHGPGFLALMACSTSATRRGIFSSSALIASSPCVALAARPLPPTPLQSPRCWAGFLAAPPEATR